MEDWLLSVENFWGIHHLKFIMKQGLMFLSMPSKSIWENNNFCGFEKIVSSWWPTLPTHWIYAMQNWHKSRIITLDPFAMCIRKSRRIPDSFHWSIKLNWNDKNILINYLICLFLLPGFLYLTFDCTTELSSNSYIWYWIQIRWFTLRYILDFHIDFKLYFPFGKKKH